MQDRFKFRAWDKKENKMIYDIESVEVIHENFKDEKIHAIPNGFGLFLNDKNIIVMQCAGFKDKNDKLIYEGDIIEVNPWFDSEQYDKEDSKFYKILWNGCSFRSYPFEYEELEPLHDSYWLKIIGNIYENPEILKGKLK